MKVFRVFGKTIYWSVIVLLLAVAAFIAVTLIDLPGNYKIQSVLSGSMEPAIKTGSIVVIKPQGSYVKNDVISFRDPLQLNTIVTHRIDGLSLKKNNYITKGDANEDRDASEVAKGNILGKVIFTLPFAGFAAEFFKGKAGLLVVLMIAVVIIFNELLSIKNESFRMLKNRNKRELGTVEKLNRKLL